MQILKMNSRGTSTLGLMSAVVLLLASLGGWYATWHHYHNGTAVTPMCVASDMRLSIGTSDGTAGTIYTNADITNQGTGSCTLGGYPTAFLTNTTGGPVGSGAVPSTLYAPSGLTIAPGHVVHTVIGFPDHGNFDPGVCSGPSTNLSVYLPGAVTALHAALAQYSCPGWSATALQSGS